MFTDVAVERRCQWQTSGTVATEPSSHRGPYLEDGEHACDLSDFWERNFLIGIAIARLRRSPFIKTRRDTTEIVSASEIIRIEDRRCYRDEQRICIVNYHRSFLTLSASTKLLPFFLNKRERERCAIFINVKISKNIGCRKKQQVNFSKKKYSIPCVAFSL